MGDVDADCFGVTIVIPLCAFEAEVSRAAIADTIRELDQLMVEGKIDPTGDDAIGLVMSNVLDSARDLAAGRIDQETAVAEIAYSLIYVVTKQVGLEECLAARGVTACYDPDENGYHIAAHTDTDKYDAAVRRVRSLAAAWLALMSTPDDDDGPRPTIH